MKKFLKILTLLILVAGSGFLLGFMDNKHDISPCRSLDITILNPREEMLITVEEATELLTEGFGPIKGTPVELLDLNMMEKRLLDNPYIFESQIYLTVTNDLYIELRVRYPVIRVINSSGQHFLIDSAGVIIPVNPLHPFSLAVANGSIHDVIPFSIRNEVPLNTMADTTVLKEVYEIGKHLYADPFLSQMIEQVYLREDGEFEMIPQIGQQSILLGSCENLKSKLDKLTAFYQQEMNQERWVRYTSINLKFENQVVCTK